MKSTNRIRGVLSVLLLAVLSATPAFAAEQARLGTAELPGGLEVLTDDAGRTLYASTTDAECTAECAEVWQPLLTSGRAIVGPGLIPGFVGSIEREEGSQITFLGQPLYYYSGDTEPGDVLGHGVDDSWFVVTHMGALHTDELPVADDVVAEDVSFEVDEEVMEIGQEIYSMYCAACHGNNGSGGGGGPAVASGTNIGNTSYVLGQIVHGGAEMPTFGAILDDEQVAAVSTYVRNSFGNSYAPISPAEVEAIR